MWEAPSTRSLALYSGPITIPCLEAAVETAKVGVREAQKREGTQMALADEIQRPTAQLRKRCRKQRTAETQAAMAESAAKGQLIKVNKELIEAERVYSESRGVSTRRDLWRLRDFVNESDMTSSNVATHPRKKIPTPWKKDRDFRGDDFKIPISYSWATLMKFFWER